RAGSGPEDLDTETSPGYAGYPILALPVGAALLAAGYELLRGRPFDRTSVLLGFGVVGALAVREAFAVADIRRYARQVAVPGALVVHVRDVGERRELERSLHRLASTDQLTGLANRRHLMRTLTAMRAEPRPSGAVLIIDLDGFTAVNDLRGHEVGDAVLVEAA